ncbi:MAG: hypothetical protein GY699_19205 [Desulfobacteraceae bacterium]|nr:hypothetical protein [Desulfobacteraceae bacterium]
MLDIAVAYNNYRFLGNEFLTWIWFLIENDEQTILQCDNEARGLEIGNRMVLENRWANGMETITIKGDTVGLEEGLLALRKGAAVTDINLIYKSGSVQWQFSLKGESLNFSSIKLPETGAAENSDDMEGLVLEKLYLYEKPFQFIDQLYRRFIKLRLSQKWKQTTDNMKKWIQSDNL